MPRRFCRLPQGFSEACAIDCLRRHNHMSVREAREAESAGDIEFLDLHPITLLPRYIERVHGTQKTHISAAVMENAAGARRGNSGRLHWADAGRREHSAREKVAEFGTYVIELDRFAWNEEGMVAGFEEDGAAKPKGNVLQVALRPKTRELVEIASAYWSFIATPPAKRTTRALAKLSAREQAAALKKLDLAWPQIVARFIAGPHSEALNSLRANELPSLILRETLRSYLQVERSSSVTG